MLNQGCKWTIGLENFVIVMITVEISLHAFFGCIGKSVIHAVEPQLSGHPRGTGKWPLPGVWPPNRGLL